jgi:hypothetical protein
MYHRHPNEIRLLARLGRIPAFKVGYSWRFRAEELSVWEKRGGNLNEG